MAKTPLLSKNDGRLWILGLMGLAVLGNSWTYGSRGIVRRKTLGIPYPEKREAFVVAYRTAALRHSVEGGLSLYDSGEPLSSNAQQILRLEAEKFWRVASDEGLEIWDLDLELVASGLFRNQNGATLGFRKFERPLEDRLCQITKNHFGQRMLYTSNEDRIEVDDGVE